MTSEGYVRIHRRLWNHPSFACEAEAAIFAWMICMAQWRATVIRTKNGDVALEAGQLIIAERTLSEKFLMHRNQVRKVINRLILNESIIVSRDHKGRNSGTIVSIVNYQQYQANSAAFDESEDHSSASHGTTVGPQRDHNGTKNNKGNKGKEYKEERDSPSLGGCEPEFEVEGDVVEPPPQADLLGNVTRLPDPVPEAVRLWNAMAAANGLSQVQKVTTPRRAAMAGRLKDCGGMEGWKHALQLVSTSPFLLGQVNSFKADFDFVTRPAKFTKLMEGGYNNAGNGQARKAAAGDAWAELRREMEERGIG